MTLPSRAPTAALAKESSCGRKPSLALVRSDLGHLGPKGGVRLDVTAMNDAGCFVASEVALLGGYARSLGRRKM